MTTKIENEPVIVTGVGKLLESVTRELHALMEAYATDPLSCLNKNKRAPDKVRNPLRHEVLFQWEVWGKGKGPELCCAIRANTYRAKELPTISVDFKAWKTLTIRVGLIGEGEPYGWLNLKSLKRLPREDRLFFLELFRGVNVEHSFYVKGEHSEKVEIVRPKSGDERWWVHPSKTPHETTQFVLMLYLFQAQMLDLDAHPDVYKALKRLFKAMGFSKNDDEEDVQFEAFLLIAKHFALPQDWRQLRMYIAKTLRTARHQRSRKLEAFASQWGVSLRTVYNWIEVIRRNRGAEKKRIKLVDSDWTEMRNRAQKLALTKRAKALLKTMGLKPDAARKCLQRRPKSKTLEDFVRDLPRRRNS